MKRNNTDSKRLTFFKSFFKNPSVIGSITPSSRFLAGKMVKEEDIRSSLNIVELGAGTGVFTGKILKYKRPESNFYVFEKDPDLLTHLKGTYSELNFFDEAGNIKQLVDDGVIGRPNIVISGLPFTVLGSQLRERILSNVYDVLPLGGKFITFQYSLDLLGELKKRYDGNVELLFEIRNIPPAVVYRCTKK